MISVKFNNRDYTVSGGSTILEASLETYKLAQEYRHVRIPTLYYRKGVVDIDESGVCIAEADGEIVNASTTRVTDGMEIQTMTPQLVEARKKALAEILRIHNKDCIDCFRNTTCEFQDLLQEYGFTDEPVLKKEDLEIIDLSSKVLVRDNNKCIRCKRCINVCAKMQAVSAICATGDGLDMVIAPASPKGLAAASCVNCGQCVSVCPVGALTEKNQISEVTDAIADPDKYVVVQTAPAVRAAIAEGFQFPAGIDSEGRLAGALRQLGFDKVFDTKYGADLTIMEEVQELTDRVKNGGVLPMITSCCPGWIKYAEHFYPEMLDHISTCKSPHMMEGAMIKSYFAEKEGIDKEKIVVVSVMPCTAKKFEITREEMAGDVDIVITTNELAKMIRDAGIQFEAMDPREQFDDPFGFGSGAGVIFGHTGGVMEAAVRTVKEKNPDLNLKTVTVSGLANANALLQKVKSGEEEYDFIEIMACPGGCVNGGGQPHHNSLENAVTNIPTARAAALNENDSKSSVHVSCENPDIIGLYEEYLGQPCGELSHKLLHTGYKYR